ncbi:hypothetical protein L0B52_02100 [Suttonella sp. R2A3]|nr:hypothetical protein [Suttonella sp. R2A3]UJF24955.1 hypothetical protein L0B52_02100 [Suttonella sp. R2A3]
MSAFFYEYGLFFAKIATFVLALVIIIGVAAAARKHKNDDDKLHIRSLNESFAAQREQLKTVLLDKKALKAHHKAEKKLKRTVKNNKPRSRICIFSILMAISRRARWLVYANRLVRYCKWRVAMIMSCFA